MEIRATALRQMSRGRNFAMATREVRPLFPVISYECKRLAIQLRRTALHDFHVENDAKMVPFAGYSMPLAYGKVGQGKKRQRCIS